MQGFSVGFQSKSTQDSASVSVLSKHAVLINTMTPMTAHVSVGLLPLAQACRHLIKILAHASANILYYWYKFQSPDHLTADENDRPLQVHLVPGPLELWEVDAPLQLEQELEEEQGGHHFFSHPDDLLHDDLPPDDLLHDDLLHGLEQEVQEQLE